MRLRFAPSPTGLLHVGNARTALFNWLLARGQGGTFILRIEDTDAERSTAESEAGILRDLRWLGLDWDEGPDVGGAHGPYRQSERLDLYRSYAAELLESHRAYYCFCHQAQLEQDRKAALDAGRPPKYVGRCRDIPLSVARDRIRVGEGAVIRFRVPEDREVTFQDIVRGTVRFGTDVIGDPVLVRTDGTPAYNFAVVIDDALMAVTHVIRGEDHISNTPRQVLLYEAMGFEPPMFAHLSLVLGPDHTPLSKRHGATSVSEFRARGYLPESLVNYLALLGWSPGGGDELLPIDELAHRFSLESVGHSAAIFDPEKLAWANRHYVRLASPERLTELATPYFAQAGYVGADTPQAREFVRALLPMVTGSVDRLEQMPERVRMVFAFDPDAALARQEIAAELADAGARAVVSELASELAAAPRLDRDGFRAIAGRIKATTGMKGTHLFHPIRVALSGDVDGPELDLLLPAIDRGAELDPRSGVAPIMGCRERATQFVRALNQRGAAS
jgi:nondiscriminating glutamyl-tRNA synthetase